MAAWLSAEPPAARRSFAATLLVVTVSAIHLVVTWVIDASLVGLGEAHRMPARMQVAFVRELQQTAPPAVPPQPAAPVAPKRRAVKPAPAASSPTPEAPIADAAPADPVPRSLVEPVPEPIPELPPSVADAPAQPPESAAPAEQTAADAAPAAASAPVASTFEWPASTRLSYVLVGNYRGEVRGNAQVEWVRSGERYQVHLDVTIGPKFAPLLTRRMSSDGVLGVHGLTPRRYDELTQRAFAEPRVVTMHFDDDEIVLGNGQRHATLPGVQDTASQFVQLIWLFTTQPQRLRPGNTIEVPLALPRKVDRWVYDVLEEETLHAPFGAVNAVRLKPQRVSRPGGDLTVETWFAPTLQYLPVRIRIHQDPDTFVELMIERPPLQAAPQDPPAAKPP
jgi:Protein of unknown function (DUF3108)